MSDLDQYQVATLDVSDPVYRSLTEDQIDEMCDVIRAHGYDPLRTYRVDLLHLDAPALRIWRYAVDEDNNVLLNETEDGAELLPPVVTGLCAPLPAWAVSSPR